MKGISKYDIYTKEILEPLVKESFSFVEISDKLKISSYRGRQTVSNNIRKFGIDISHFTHRKFRLNAEEIQSAKNDYDNGLTWQDISKKYNIAKCTIRKYVKKGIFQQSKHPSLRTSPERKAEANKKRNQLYKEHPERHPLFKLRGKQGYLSYPERITFRFLEELGIKFEPQFHESPYWLDFLVEDKLNLEVDGEKWHKPNNEKDAKRDKYISSLGYTIIRVPAKGIYENLKIIFKDYNKDIKLDLDKIKKETILVKIELVKKYCLGYNGIICGKEITPNAERCRDCCFKHSDVFKITKEDLTELCKTMHVTDIAKKFNISRETVRRTCVELGINYINRVEDQREISKKCYELYLNGVKPKEISEILFLGIEAVRTRIKVLRIQESSYINTKIKHKELQNKCCELHLLGVSYKEIAEQLNISEASVRGKLKNLRIELNGGNIKAKNKEITNQCFELSAKGIHYKEIAIQLGITSESARHRLSERNRKPRKPKILHSD